MLKIDKIKVVYSGVVLALNEVSIVVPEGNIVALIGSNGSGKSTTLKSISGVLATEDGKVTEGTIMLDGKRIDRLVPEQIARIGICHVLQGRSVFTQLTTEENLLMGAYLRKDRQKIKEDLYRIYHYFPMLETLRQQKSGYLSGGEQQMLVISRAFMARPKIMLFDEPSLGLAPKLISNIYDIIKQMNREDKTSLVIAEQNAVAALSIAAYGYVLQNGRITSEGPAEILAGQQAVKEGYLGLDGGGKFISRHAMPSSDHGSSSGG
jgi:branched-chain amino acid transport system ATP-binding protein